MAEAYRETDGTGGAPSDGEAAAGIAAPAEVAAAPTAEPGGAGREPNAGGDGAAADGPAEAADAGRAAGPGACACAKAPEGGLRARKKHATRVAIERTILELVLERGYEAATVDEVCSRVGISKKTFFNYYATKEAAIRGDAMVVPSREEAVAVLEQKDPGASYLDVIVDMLSPVEALAGSDPDVARLRSEVLSAMPQLLYHGHREVALVLKQLGGILADYLERHPESRLVVGCSVADEATAAASSAVSMARVRFILSARRKEAVDLDEVRRLLAACLCAEGPQA